MSEAARKHDRRFGLDCGGVLNGHEWYYGACSGCIKQRAKRNRWTPRGNGGHVEWGWFYADNAPRLKDYTDYHDLDDEGVISLVTAAFGGRSHYAKQGPEQPDDGRTPPPLGTKRCIQCHKLIPTAGFATCPECLAKHQVYLDARRRQWAAAGCCSACGAKLPKGWDKKSCQKCLDRAKKYQINARAKREGMTL